MKVSISYIEANVNTLKPLGDNFYYKSIHVPLGPEFVCQPLFLSNPYQHFSTTPPPRAPLSNIPPRPRTPAIHLALTKFPPAAWLTPMVSDYAYLKF